MNKLLIIYATVDGQAELIARRIAQTASRSGVEAAVRNVRDKPAADLTRCGSVIIVASVRYGRHSRAITRFVRANRERLASLPSALVSVSGSAVDAATRPEAEQYVHDFLRITGWTPAEQLLIGGAVKFTKYNFLIRLITRRAFAAKGVTIDSRRDHDFTDWQAVERFAEDFVARRALAVA